MLIGCLMGLGVLASQSELTVMRASGVSVLRIVWMVIRPVLVLVLVICLAREFIVPSSDRYADYFRAEKIEQDAPYNLIRSQRGVWMRDGNHFLHFNYVSAKGEIFGFARLAFDNHGELLFGQYAPQAVHNNDEKNPGWHLENVRTTVVGENATQAGSQEDFWSSKLSPALLAAVATDPDEMSIRELHYYMNFLVKQGQDAGLFKFYFWRNVLLPFAMVGLVLVAISFIFGPLRETSMGYRLFAGVMLGMLFRFGQNILGPVSLVYGFAPWLAVAVPILACWLLGFFMLLRMR
jgi:lipopolysaccharide export system permease protein